MPVQKPKCVRCDKKPAKHPKDRPMFCSFRCVLNSASEQRMDWDLCPHCNQWMDTRYNCRNDDCPSKKEDVK